MANATSGLGAGHRHEQIVRALPLAVAGAPEDPHPTAFVADIVMAFQGHGLYSRARCDRGV